MFPLETCVLLLSFSVGLSHATNLVDSDLEDTGSTPQKVSFEDKADVSLSQGSSRIAFQSDNLGLTNYCIQRDFYHFALKDQGNTLRQVLLVHRHGDRTPVKFRKGDPLAKETFWRFHGFGQLTNRGKERMYVLGELMRYRYENFIQGSVNKNMRLSRSSGAPRCIESAQVFLAAFLSLDAPKSPDAKALKWSSGSSKVGNLWQPASVQTMATSMDGMLAEGADCDAMTDELDNTIEKTQLAKWIHTEFKKEVKPLEEVLGYKMDNFYKWSWASGHMEVEHSYFENKLDPQLIAIYDRVQEAGRHALIAEYSTVKSRRLRSGLLINDMIEHMKKSRQQNLMGEESKKLIHYSTHDVNLFSLLGILGNSAKFPFSPSFASSIIMELHQDGDEWFVKFFYMPHVPTKIFEIHVSSCDSDHPKKLCTLNKLEEVVRPYSIKDWSSWMKECRNDMKKVNPY